MIGDAVILNTNQRRCVEEAVDETCRIRGWELQAINVRTNHVHVVVCAGAKPETALNAFKANATRKMRENGCWKSPELHGSIKEVTDIFGTRKA